MPIKQILGFIELGLVTDRVNPNAGRLGEHGLDPVRVLLEEEGEAVGVERRPHEGVVAEAENEEVASVGVRPQDVERDLDLRPRLLGHVFAGGVVEHRLELDGGDPVGQAVGPTILPGAEEGDVGGGAEVDEEDDQGDGEGEEEDCYPRALEGHAAVPHQYLIE